MFYQQTRTAKAAAIGTIMPWSGGLTSIPAGWIICDGQTVAASDYPLLAQTIGDTYNAGTTDFGGNFPNYVGSIKMPNLNNKILMDVETSYFASVAAGGTGRAADIDPVALSLLSPLIGTNEDLGVTTIFTDVYVDVVFNISSTDRTGYVGRIAGNTLINGESFKSVYIGPRKLGRNHVKRHNHSGTIETLDNGTPTQPGTGVIPYREVAYTLYFQATDNIGNDGSRGDTFYFGWSTDSSYRPSPSGGGVDFDPVGTADTRPGIVGGTGWGGTSTGSLQGLYALRWPSGGEEAPNGFGVGSPGKTLAKVLSEAPPVNLSPRQVLKTPISEFFLTTPSQPSGKYISGSVPYGVGGTTVSIPEGFTNYYSTSDVTVRNTLMNSSGLNFTSDGVDMIMPHTHDEFDVSFDSTRMRPQSNITAQVNLPVSTVLDNVANRNALQVDFNVQQPTMSCIYIIRAY